MRYIRKGEEPESLTQYKKESNAYYDGYADKDDIRRNLMEDQGYLCGYCMRRLNDISDVKIEHIVPQSTLKDDEKKALDYRIMVGVCYGNEKKGRRKECLTCDAHRGSKDLYVDPFDENNINQIEYDSEGYITSQNEEIKKSLQETLNLNYDGPDAYLVQNRKEVLKKCKDKLRTMQKEGLWKRQNLERILKFYQEKDEEGKYIPYSGIAIWYITKRLKRN